MMVRIRALVLVMLTSIWAPAVAQPIDSVRAEEYERPFLANPVRPTFPDNARFIQPGQIQLETGYMARIFEGDTPTLHAVDMLGVLGVTDLVEARLRFNVFNAWGDDTGVGDIAAGIKGGFFGGLGENTALAGLFEMQFPIGMDPFGIDKGVVMTGGLVATQIWAGIQFDLQATVYTHLFQGDPTFELPLALGVTWSPIYRLRILGDAVERLDLTNLSDSTTSVMGGVGYALTCRLVVDAWARVGLSQRLPDVELGAGLTWLVADIF